MAETHNNEPKPCPFCGWENPTEARVTSLANFVRCSACGASSDCHETHAEALAAWNRRALPWVPVAERLPEPEQVCLWVAGKVLWIGVMEKHDWHPNFYTHWLPLSDDFFPAVDKLAQGGAGKRETCQ